MQNRWNDRDAAACAGELALRAYSSRLIGGDPALVLCGGADAGENHRHPDRGAGALRGPLRRGAWLLCLASLLLTAAVQGASFDCGRARTKLYRIICADPELSALDEQVWNAYGERIKSLGPAQYGQVRDRHITWRRERGLYDRSIAGLIDDYRLHLAWLRHPLLALEGRYQRADGAEITIEIDLGSANTPPAVVAIGRAGALQWLPPRAGLAPNTVEPDEGAGSPRASVAVDHGVLRLAPNFIGTPQGAIQDCALEVRFENDAAQITASGLCGADFAGSYGLIAPEHPWPQMRRAADAADRH